MSTTMDEAMRRGYAERNAERPVADSPSRPNSIESMNLRASAYAA